MHGITEDLSTNAPPSNSYSGEPLATKLRITPGIFRGKMGPGGGGQGDGGGAWPPACVPQEQVEGVDQAEQRGGEQPEREGGADLAQHAGREGLVHRVVQEKWTKNEENGDDSGEECQFDRILPTPHIQEQGVIATQTDEINCDSFLYFFCSKEIYTESK